MREIKFKAKRINDRKWVKGGYSYCEADDTHYITEMGKDHISHIGFHQQVDPETICEYINLKDKNKKEIFEGDIVESIGVRLNGEMTKFIGVIKWINCEFMICRECECYNQTEPLMESGIYNVIGNIHDNPELMEETENV